jgi:hypothetical protein
MESKDDFGKSPLIGSPESERKKSIKSESDGNDLNSFEQTGAIKGLNSSTEPVLQPVLDKNL